MDSVVLEARTRVGGRVYTHRGGGFSVPIDLGASIITGISVDLAKGARADPSAVIARYATVSRHLAACRFKVLQRYPLCAWHRAEARRYRDEHALSRNVHYMEHGRCCHC